MDRQPTLSDFVQQQEERSSAEPGEVPEIEPIVSESDDSSSIEAPALKPSDSLDENGYSPLSADDLGEAASAFQAGAFSVSPDERADAAFFGFDGHDGVGLHLDGGSLDSVPLDEGANKVIRAHLRGLLEALIFVSDKPLSVGDLIKTAKAERRLVREVLQEIQVSFEGRGIQLIEVAGGFAFRTNPAYAPFIRDIAAQKPVKLTRAQVETLAILAYRQPVTRPEIDDIRGVDSGPVLKVLLERELIRILGKRDEPGRPLIYGTTPTFLQFFGLKSLKDLPSLQDFTELTEESRRTFEREIGEDAPSGADELEAALKAQREAEAAIPPPTQQQIFERDAVFDAAVAAEAKVAAEEWAEPVVEAVVEPASDDEDFDPEIAANTDAMETESVQAESLSEDARIDEDELVDEDDKQEEAEIVDGDD